MSMAVDVNAVRSCAVVSPGLAAFSKAAMAAACGAAADVPQNGLNPGVEVITQSAAAMSGFCRTVPPVDEKSPGVIAVPLAKKNTCRSPSELYVSTGLLAPPTNGVDRPCAVTAATLNASTAAECPEVCPAVLIDSRPPLALR